MSPHTRSVVTRGGRGGEVSVGSEMGHSPFHLLHSVPGWSAGQTSSVHPTGDDLAKLPPFHVGCGVVHCSGWHLQCCASPVPKLTVTGFPEVGGSRSLSAFQQCPHSWLINPFSLPSLGLIISQYRSWKPWLPASNPSSFHPASNQQS